MVLALKNCSFVFSHQYRKVKTFSKKWDFRAVDSHFLKLIFPLHLKRPSITTIVYHWKNTRAWKRGYGREKNLSSVRLMEYNSAPFYCSVTLDFNAWSVQHSQMAGCFILNQSNLWHCFNIYCSHRTLLPQSYLPFFLFLVCLPERLQGSCWPPSKLRRQGRTAGNATSFDGDLGLTPAVSFCYTSKTLTITI